MVRQTDVAIKLIAANVNTITIVCAIEPAPSFELIDHYIVAAENLSASAVLVINKIDLMEASKVTQSINNRYKCLPYPIFETSAQIPSGLEQLLQQLKNHTCVFVGQSGVGKSTLINSLIPKTNIYTQEISDVIQQGKHTTSTTTLYDLPQGGELIDSPGVRDFSLLKLDQKKIALGFRDIANLSHQCKYHDCIHINEPGCAVKNAMKNGVLNAERYSSYKKMIEQYG